MQHRDAVVITGGGWVASGKTGSIAQCTELYDLLEQVTSAEDLLHTVPQELRQRYPDLPRELQQDKCSWMTAIAIEHALTEAALSCDAIDPDRSGMVFGCPLAGQLGMVEFASAVREQSARFVSPIHFPQTVGNYPAGAIARAYNLRGPNLTIAGGSATALDALAEAYDIIQSRQADLMFAGVSETSTDPLPRAFDESDQNLVEGACWLLLERRDARTSQKHFGEIRSWRNSDPESDESPNALEGSWALLLAIADPNNAQSLAAKSSSARMNLALQGRDMTVGYGSGSYHATKLTITRLNKT